MKYIKTFESFEPVNEEIFGLGKKGEKEEGQIKFMMIAELVDVANNKEHSLTKSNPGLADGIIKEWKLLKPEMNKYMKTRSSGIHWFNPNNIWDFNDEELVKKYPNIFNKLNSIYSECEKKSCKIPCSGKTKWKTFQDVYNDNGETQNSGGLNSLSAHSQFS